MDTSTLGAQYAWAGASSDDKRAVATIFKRFEEMETVWSDLVQFTWPHWQVHAYFVTAGRDLDRACADIESQVKFAS